MARKIRKDITVGGLEKKLGVAPGTIKNADGRDVRSDKKLATLQKEAIKATETKKAGKRKSIAEPKNTKPVAKNLNTTVPKGRVKATEGKSTAKTSNKPKIDPTRIVTVDQQVAARRTVKSHPKSAGLVRQLRAAQAAKTKK